MEFIMKGMEWLRDANKNPENWEVDMVKYLNEGTILAYKGEEDGAFLTVGKEGDIEFGYYKGAYPYITDGLFERIGNYKFNGRENAVNNLKEKGFTFLNFLDEYINNLL